MYYNMVRFGLIFGSFLLAQSQQILYAIDNIDGRFGNEWVVIFTFFNLALLADLVLHVVFYGFKTIIKLRKEYIWEALCQISAFVTLFVYASCDIDNLNKQI